MTAGRLGIIQDVFMPHPGVTAQKFPSRPAVIMGSSGEVVTYRQLEERTNQGAHLFRSLGLQPGDHICILMENNLQFLTIVWAAQRSEPRYRSRVGRLRFGAQRAWDAATAGSRMLWPPDGTRLSPTNTTPARV